jgi:hypothetical protein
MTAQRGPAHVVVDGSNIATEGRSLPSLSQLNDAVLSYKEEHPDTAITVVVDATFGHRIEKKEIPEFEAGIANNELVAPPAGAVGRGDAFVLSIADKANATVLSNDSFQEFHGEYAWLFDDGRLVGGKPVPHVGWVFVDRVPVRGPVSRAATNAAKKSRSTRGAGSRGRQRTASPEASQPMPVPTSPPPGVTSGAAAGTPDAAPSRPAASAGHAPRRGEPVNELLPFLEFVEHHPIGTSVNGTVDAYSSHGAYITIGDEGVRGYIPLRMMADPPPRSARQQMKLGESVTVVVTSFAAARRSIDCAMPDMADRADADADVEAAAPVVITAGEAPPKRSRRRPAKKAATTGEPPATEPDAGLAAGPAAAPAKRAAKTSAAKKVPAKKAPAKQAAAQKVPAKKAPVKKAPAKKAPAKKAPAKKAAAKRAPAKKAATKRSPAKKAPARRSASPAPEAAASDVTPEGG